MTKFELIIDKVITPKVVQEIIEIPHFKSSIYHNLDIAKTVLFFKSRYIEQLNRYVDTSKSTLIDCASGYGWLSFSYILSGGKFAYAIDLDKERLNAAKRIAEILSIASKIDFIHSPIEKIPLPDKSVDIFVCIETLEHVGKNNINASIESIQRLTKNAIIITTPNKFFPAIAHDTRIPFLHWLSPVYRKPFSKIFGRLEKDDGNEFLNPSNLIALRREFLPVSSCLTFKEYKDYENSFPFYQPYGAQDKDRWIEKPTVLKKMYYKMAAKILRQNAYWVMPSLTNIFIKKS